MVSTRLSGVPELIADGINGLLAEPDDQDALGNALKRLITAPELRRQLGNAGRAVVLTRFDMAGNFEQLHRMITGEA